MVAGTADPVTLSGDFTDADGFYNLTIVNSIPSGLYDFRFRPPGGSHFFAEEMSGFFIGGNTALGVTILDSGWFFSGRVVDEDGIGLSGVDLNFMDATGTPFAPRGSNEPTRGSTPLTRYAGSGSQLPWNPKGTRWGNFTRARGSAAKFWASSTTKSLALRSAS